MIHTILHKQTNAIIQPFITLLQPDGRYMVRLFEPLEFSKEDSHQELPCHADFLLEQANQHKPTLQGGKET
jgi:hypothetical protein